MAVTERLTPEYSPDQLPPMDVAGRVARLRPLIERAGCDALVVANLTNVRYLTGFTGSAALVLVTPDELLFVSDGRYQTQSADQLGAAGVDARIEIVAADPDAVVAGAATRGGRAAPGARVPDRHLGTAAALGCRAVRLGASSSRPRRWSRTCGS